MKRFVPVLLALSLCPAVFAQGHAVSRAPFTGSFPKPPMPSPWNNFGLGVEFLLRARLVQVQTAPDGTQKEMVVATSLCPTSRKACKMNLRAGAQDVTVSVLPRWDEATQTITLRTSMNVQDAGGKRIRMARAEDLVSPGQSTRFAVTDGYSLEVTPTLLLDPAF